MNDEQPQRVGVVGLGAIGAPIARNLARSGCEVMAWNRTVSVVEASRGDGLVPATLEDIGRGCRLVLTVLPDLPDVDEVLLAGLAKGLFEAVGRGVSPILVVMGTVSPQRIVDLARRLERDGIAVVDAPVSGGDVGAERAELSIMAGGSAGDVRRVASVLDPACGTVRHVGEVGSGSLVKACNQLVVGATLTALAEALTLARVGGIDDALLLDVLADGLAGSKVLDVKREKWVSEDFTPGGRARFQLKDLVFAQEAGAAHGLPMPLTARVSALYDALVAAGHGDEDHAAIIRVLGPDGEPDPSCG